ncbi:MAG TPA: diacylglycerol kinase family protein [Solirubrobacteraceae bacterium]|nr:diacylglycerol kinase family protein [Solirubrobacteraceae bacterium]
MTAPLRLIVNPLAGGGRSGRTLARVRRELARHRLVHHVAETRDLTHARALAREAAAAGEVAVAFGGDGLIGAVADALRDTDGVMGVLPGGRGNDFVRALGIPLDAAQACAVLAGGRPRALDLGTVDGRGFVGIASCGFDSDANRVANRAQLIRGSPVYAYGALRALARWRPATFTVTIDGGRARTIDGYTVAAANSPFYGGGMQLAPAADLSDGRLDVVIIHDLPRIRFLTLMPTVFTGAHVMQPVVEIVRGRSVEIAASRPFEVYADGEAIAELPARISVLPGAMRVIVPPAAEPALGDAAPVAVHDGAGR